MVKCNQLTLLQFEGLIKNKLIFIIRPPDVVASAVVGFAAILSSMMYLFFFVSYPRRSLNGNQPKPATMFENACRKFGVSLLLKIRGPTTTHFRRSSATSLLNAVKWGPKTVYIWSF